MIEEEDDDWFDDMEEIPEMSDTVIKQNNPETIFNVLNLETNQNLITDFQIFKHAKDAKLKGQEKFSILKLFVKKQQTEFTRRPTKASLARERKIRQLYPNIFKKD